MRIDVLDPPAYTPPYDHALCAALARHGAEVELVTSRFPYSSVPEADGYRRREAFYRLDVGPAGSRRRRLARLASHPWDMGAYARRSHADVSHFQWLTLHALDRHLLPRGRPVVVTAHDALSRAPTHGGRRAQAALWCRADAVVVHSHAGRRRLIEAGVAAERIEVIRHGAFEHLTRLPEEASLPAELAAVERPVVLCFGLLRPHKGLDVLLEAWRGIDDAELWIVGLPRMDLGALRARAPRNVRWIPRFVADAEIPAFFRRADLVVLPYREIDQSGVVFTALAFGRPMVLSAVGGFPEVAGAGAAELVAPGDVDALRTALAELVGDEPRRAALAAGARAAADGEYGWDGIARDTLALYERVRAAAS